MSPQIALKYDVEVESGGHVQLDVPFPPGARLTVFVIKSDDAFNDLLMAAQSSTEFWNNPWDDEGR